MFKLNKYKKIIIISMSFIILFSGFYYKVNAAIEVSGNTSPKAAFEIPAFPYTVNFKCDSNEDVDWFKVVVNKRGALKLTVAGGAGLDYKLYKESDMGSANPKHLYNKNIFRDESASYKVEAGTYYIRFAPWTSGYYSKDNINLVFQLLEEDMHENNDTASLAKKLELKQEYDFTVNAENDVDWFKVDINKSGALKVKVSGGAGLDYKLYKGSEINNSNPEHIYSNNIFRDESASYKVEAGTYYIRFAPWTSGGYWSEQKVNLVIDLLEEDTFENNDVASRAKLIELGKKYDFTVNAENDVDWFKIKLNRAGALKVNVSGGAGLDYKLYKESEIGNSNPSHIYNNNIFRDESASYKVEAGTYYIRFAPWTSGGYWSEEKVSLIIDLLEEDIFENNDTASKAKELEVNNNYKFTINAENDVDWFKVKVDRAVALKVEVSGGAGLDYKLYKESEINNSNPKYIYNNNIFRDESASYKVEAGTYYIRFAQWTSGGYWSEDDINLSIKLLEEYDYPNNATWQNAGIVTLGQEAKIAINSENDVDWFKFNIDSDSQIKINLQGTGERNRTLKYYIYNESTISQTNPAAVTSGTVGTNNGTIGVKLNKGNYYIKLQPNNSNEYIEEAIKFRIYKDGNDITRPEITKYSPTGNIVDVYSNIEIVFSKPMNVSTLTKENIKVKCYNEEIDFDIEWVEGTNKVILKPKNRLNFSSEYTVEVSDKVKADNGYTISKVHSWNFKTRAKRADDDLVGSVSGNVKLSSSLQSLAVATTIEVYDGSKKIKTAYPDRYGKFVINDIPQGKYKVWAKLPGFLDVSKEVEITAYNESKVELSPIYGDSNDDNIIDIFDLSGVAKDYDKRSE